MDIPLSYYRIYRAVSDPEIADMAANGLRNKEGAYETGKLFALTIEDASKFGKNNFFGSLDQYDN